MKHTVKWILILTIFILNACTNEPGFYCTEEFRMINVSIQNPDNTPADFDDYYVIKTQSGDTVHSKEKPAMESDFYDGIIIFTDNDSEYTNSEGSEFVLHVFRAGHRIVNETYIIAFDGCHINLLEGNTDLVYEEK